MPIAISLRLSARSFFIGGERSATTSSAIIFTRCSLPLQHLLYRRVQRLFHLCDPASRILHLPLRRLRLSIQLAFPNRNSLLASSGHLQHHLQVLDLVIHRPLRLWRGCSQTPLLLQVFQSRCPICLFFLFMSTFLAHAR